MWLTAEGSQQRTDQLSYFYVEDYSEYKEKQLL